MVSLLGVFIYNLIDNNRKHQHGRGICSVFILDTSESMEGEGLRQMKKAFLDILNGKIPCYYSTFFSIRTTLRFFLIILNLHYIHFPILAH